jgi:predicted nucleotidyltransferase
MINIDDYVQCLADLLKNSFGNRLLYVGLQGSYLRGEATEHSDIDIMVVIDDLQIDDLDQYRVAIQMLEYADKSCGFICGKEDLANWNPLEIHHLLNSTKDYFGELRRLVPVYNERDIQKFVKLSVNNLYHELCHRYIHADIEMNAARLPSTYKGVFFILQNLYYLRSREFVNKKTALSHLLSGKDQAVLLYSMSPPDEICKHFPEAFDLLFTWCQETLASL